MQWTRQHLSRQSLHKLYLKDVYVDSALRYVERGYADRSPSLVTDPCTYIPPPRRKKLVVIVFKRSKNPFLNFSITGDHS